LVDELTVAKREYVYAMAKAREPNHVASTTAVADVPRGKVSRLSRLRDRLLRNGIIVAPKRGYVRLNIAYLRDYLACPHTSDDEVALAEAWET
jgi:hypothetical protein